MIFVYPEAAGAELLDEEHARALDLGYLTATGVVRDLRPAAARREARLLAQRPDIQFALEMPKGWFAAHGVRAGTGIDLKAVAGALRARGFDPVKFGLEKRQGPLSPSGFRCRCAAR
jgi:uncharacterized protein